jgi:two-component system chemotaxis response regulator CheY
MRANRRNNSRNNIVMVVDDDIFVRKVVADTVREFAEVVEIGDGAQVVQQYKTNMPDMVFLDIHLPNQSGLELLKQIRELDPDAYVIMLSADSTQDNVDEGNRFGIQGFLTKPFKRTRIISFLNKCPTIKFVDAGKF